MFYYYGRKKKIGKYYPKPSHDIIIEPFAGSAAYCLRDDNWKKDIILVEKDKGVYDIWDWLINEACLDDIEKMQELKVGDKSSELLHILHAASKMAFTYKTIKVTEVLQRNWKVTLRILTEDLYKVKHWKVIHGDYSMAPDIEATWFIDPPYSGEAGTGYRESSRKIDYDELSKWCTSRKGQVIVCESSEANWLPFEKLVDLVGVAGKKSSEGMFYVKDNHI